MEFLFFAVVCLGFFSISDGSIICHEGDDWIPYENCLGFYRCVHGSPSAFDCPAGLRFSLILHVCVWPGDAHDNCEVQEESSCYDGSSCSNCLGGELNLDLDSGEVCTTRLKGVSLQKYPEEQDGLSMPCSMSALIKAKFTTPTSAVCRNLLEIEMTLGPEADRKDMLFNIGDSISNNGAAGDYYDQSNDAEIDNYERDVRIWGSDDCPYPDRLLKLFENVLPDAANSTVTFLIGDRYMKITNSDGFSEEFCHEDCLFALNNQPDSEGDVNREIFVAFNGVVRGDGLRKGYGVCHARVNWKCPETVRK